VTRFQNQFLSAVKQLGWPEIEDLQNLESCNGAQRALRTISPDGQRQDTASRYLHPKLHGEAHPNLHVVVESQVIRVVADDGRAVGVEFRRNPLFNKGDEASSRARMVKAGKTVVVSCGALGTPLVLERSGLGDPAVLERAGVPLAVSLPGVGHECEDHQLNVYPYRSSLDPEDTLDALVGGRLDVGALIQNKDKILGWNAMDVTCKLRPSKADVAALGPAFQEAWDRDFEQVPDRPLAMINPVNG
jgi:choline dehydrogenase-like flavoprotein